MALNFQVIYDIVFPQSTVPGLNAVQHPIARQITIALTEVAFGITSEATTVPNHDTRVAWARMVLQSPQQYVQKFLLALMHTPAIASVADLKAIPYSAVLALVDGYVDRLNS